MWKDDIPNVLVMRARRRCCWAVLKLFVTSCLLHPLPRSHRSSQCFGPFPVVVTSSDPDNLLLRPDNVLKDYYGLFIETSHTSSLSTAHLEPEALQYYTLKNNRQQSN